MPRQAQLDLPETLNHGILRGIEKKNIVDDKYTEILKHGRSVFIFNNFNKLPKIYDIEKNKRPFELIPQWR